MIIKYLRRLFKTAKLTLEYISYRKYGKSGFEAGLVELDEVSLRIEKLSKEIYLKLDH